MDRSTDRADIEAGVFWEVKENIGKWVVSDELKYHLLYLVTC